jgi:alanyl-tRNA synthetase
VKYGDALENDQSLRVIADHARACVFLITDGILPSNEGRGYVLRRILRRAARHGRKLGLTGPFLHKVAHSVIDEMKVAYPGLEDSRVFVDKVIITEEERFGETLDTGLKLLAEAVREVKPMKGQAERRDVAFKLYDTYGFPLDLTMTIVAEDGMEVDEKPGLTRPWRNSAPAPGRPGRARARRSCPRPFWISRQPGIHHQLYRL